MANTLAVPEAFNLNLSVEDLSMAIWGSSDIRSEVDDADIIGIAARKIMILRNMLVASGFNENMLKAIMEA